MPAFKKKKVDDQHATKHSRQHRNAGKNVHTLVALVTALDALFGSCTLPPAIAPLPEPPWPADDVRVLPLPSGPPNTAAAALPVLLMLMLLMLLLLLLLLLPMAVRMGGRTSEEALASSDV